MSEINNIKNLLIEKKEKSVAENIFEKVGNAYHYLINKDYRSGDYSNQDNKTSGKIRLSVVAATLASTLYLEKDIFGEKLPWLLDKNDFGTLFKSLNNHYDPSVVNDIYFTMINTLQTLSGGNPEVAHDLLSQITTIGVALMGLQAAKLSNAKPYEEEIALYADKYGYLDKQYKTSNAISKFRELNTRMNINKLANKATFNVASRVTAFLDSITFGVLYGVKNNIDNTFMNVSRKIFNSKLISKLSMSENILEKLNKRQEYLDDFNLLNDVIEIRKKIESDKYINENKLKPEESKKYGEVFDEIMKKSYEDTLKLNIKMSLYIAVNKLNSDNKKEVAEAKEVILKISMLNEKTKSNQNTDYKSLSSVASKILLFIEKEPEFSNKIKSNVFVKNFIDKELKRLSVNEDYSPILTMKIDDPISFGNLVKINLDLKLKEIKETVKLQKRMDNEKVKKHSFLNQKLKREKKNSYNNKFKIIDGNLVKNEENKLSIKRKEKRHI